MHKEEALGFGHVSFTVAGRAELFGLKDRLEAAGVDVHGAVDHGLFWSIYFYDPNNIPLEAAWEFMEVIEPPAVLDDAPLAVAAEGNRPQPGHASKTIWNRDSSRWRIPTGTQS